MFHRRGWTSLAGFLSVALVLLAGCGGTAAPAPSGTAAPAPAPAGTAPAQGAALRSVVIGKAINDIPFDVADIAEQQGYFRQQHIRAKIEVLKGSTVADAAMVAGDTQFTLASSLALLLGRQKGLDLMSIDALQNGAAEQMIVSDRWLASHHLSSSEPIGTRLRGLAGSVFGQAGPTDRAFFSYALRRYGLSARGLGVRFVEMQAGAAQAASLKRGQIDEFQLSPPTSLGVVAQGFGQVLLNYKSIPEFADMAYTIAITTSSYAKAHPRTVGGVATALAEGNNFIRSHPRQALTELEHLWPQLSPSVIRQSMALLTFPAGAQQSATLWNNAVKVMASGGLVHPGVTARRGVAWTNRYIASSALNG